MAARIRELDDDDFDTRVAAMRALRKVAEVVESELRQALANPRSLEMRRRVEQLLAALKTTPPTGDLLRQLRALTVLERIGDEPARRCCASWRPARRMRG